MDREELARRIGAGLRLRGITQAELGDLFKEDGLGREDPGRIQRGELGMQRIHLDAFSRHLELPADFFTGEDPFVSRGASEGELRERMEEMYQALLAGQARLLGELGKVQSELAVLRDTQQRRGRLKGDVRSG